MFTDPAPLSFGGDASASTHSPAAPSPAAPSATPTTASDSQSLPPQTPPPELPNNSVRHMLFGSAEAVQQTVHNLHSRGYADPNDWSPAISTGRCNEVMRLLIRRVPTLGG